MFNSNVIKRKSNFLRNLILLFVTIVFIFFLFIVIRKVYISKTSGTVSRNQVVNGWKKFDYQEVYNLTEKLLLKNQTGTSALARSRETCLILQKWVIPG